MYRYETHMHTAPASQCATATVRESLEFYKELGYDGVFITNHFLDGNININYRELPFKEKLELFCEDYEAGVKIGKEIGIKVFFGVELPYKGTDFLVYGLDKDWYMAHPEIMDMKKSEELPFLMENGGFIIQAHPFRDSSYIDHIRLFPKCVNGIEVLNSSRPEFENKMAELYADHYNLLKMAGSDNHYASARKHLAGMETDTPINNEHDFIEQFKNGKLKIFEMNVE